MLPSKPLISIVVPTYNRLNFLKECVDSLLHQTYKNIEIIITDDGSSDGTFEWVHGIQKLHNNVKYVKNRKYPHGSNGNKNNGLDHVSGEIVGILDDDDLLLSEAIEVIMQKMQEGYDVVMTNCIRSDNKKFSGWGVGKSCEIDPKDIFCGRIDGEFWSLFKKDLLGKKRFDTQIYGGEGLLWKEMLKNAKIYYIHKGLRIYRIHTQSVMHSTFANAQRVLQGYEKDIERNSEKMLLWCPCRLAQLYKASALFARWTGDIKKSYDYLINAVRICPGLKTVYGMFLLMVLPKKLILSIRSLLKRFSRR